jgi:hypothetical protein
MIKYFFESFRDTLIFMNARWNFIRSRKSKFLLWVGIASIFIAIFLASNTGYLIRYIAEGNSVNDTALKQYAIIYLQSYMRGELGILVSGTLGVAIISVFVSPFTGTVSTSLISAAHIVSVRRDDKHRFTDSIFTQFFSSISLLQLLTLTTVASLLTIDGNNTWGILYAWMTWPALVLLSVFFLWGAEYLYRVFGEKTRLLIAGLFLALIGLAIVLNPKNGETVFGIGEIYSYNVKNFDNFDTDQKIIALGALFFLSIAFFFGAYFASIKTLAHPERMKQEKKRKRAAKWQTSPFYMVEAVKVLFLQVWRNPETKKPIIATILFGAVMIFATGGTFSVSSTFVIIVPLIVSIAWGSNLFGVLGQGFSWMSSQPYIMGNFLLIAYFTQVVITSGIYGLILLPSIITGKVPTESIAGMILAFIAVNVAMSRSAIEKSAKYPFPVRAGARGESILPPATIIGYTLRFSLWTGQLGVIILVSGDILLQMAITFLVITWSMARLALLHKKWNREPAMRNKILLTVNNS